MTIGLIMLATSINAIAIVSDFNNVIPRPNNITILSDSDHFSLNNNTVVCYDIDNESNSIHLRKYIKDATGIDLKTTHKKHCKNFVRLAINEKIYNPEGYRISVSKNCCLIEGKTKAGVFYGIQTLRKSFVPEKSASIDIPIVLVEDEPRFGYRGALLDVSRHFFKTEDIYRFIDMLALHNLNIFHWHLSDDQGWRIEIKSRPELTAKASVRPETVIGHNTPKYDGKPHGGFYTQQEVRDIVEYASDRNIVIVPEIDLPGHAQASLTAYPNIGCTGGPYELWKIWGVSEEVLCAGNDSTYRFIEDVLGEVADMFPGELIHIGGDECPKTRWKNCAKCQAKIKELGLTDQPGRTAEQQLQRYIMEFAQDFLTKRGKRVIGWDEMLEGGIGGNAVIMSWQGEKGGIEAAKMGLDVIMTPTSHMYFDYYQTSDIENEPNANDGYLPIEKVYGYDPVPKELTPEQSKHIIGSQACLWSAYIPTFKDVEYMSLPRLAALSEVQWCMHENKDYKRFTNSLETLLRQYDSMGLNYSRRLFDVDAKFSTDADAKHIMVTLDAVNNAKIYYTLDGSEPDTKKNLYTKPFEITNSSTLKAIAIHDGFGTGPVYNEKIDIHKGVFRNITLHTSPSSNWCAAGCQTLNDALHGNANRESGRWMGFREEDLVATIELGDDNEVSEVEVSTCMVKNKWSFHASKIVVELSGDGVTFTTVATEEYPHITWDQNDGVRKHSLKFEPSIARYVRVTVQPDRKPEGHNVHGGGYVFVDEIVIR